MLALCMAVTWRINQLMRLGRNHPALPVDIVFAEEEWQAAYILNKKAIPKTAPPIGEVVRLVAQTGRFIGRKGDSEPGAKTLWPGLRDVAVAADTLRAARGIIER